MARDELSRVLKNPMIRVRGAASLRARADAIEAAIRTGRGGVSAEVSFAVDARSSSATSGAA
jgi:hypothetical protein